MMVTKTPTFKRDDCQKFKPGDRVESSIEPGDPGKILGWFDMPGDNWHGYYAVLWKGWRGEDNAEPHDDTDLQPYD